MSRAQVILLATAVLAVITLLLCPMIGTSFIIPFRVLGLGADDHLMRIFYDIRVPRVALGFVCGGGLAVSGLAFQAIFRNPLATPFTLGISTGASLGAAVFIRIGIPLTFLGGFGISLFAFLGAVSSIFIVYGFTKVRKRLSTATMLLAGVAVSFCFSSLILFLQYTADFRHSFQIVRWLMGGLEVVGFAGVWNVMPLVIVGSLIVYSMSNELNLMTAGEDVATSRGVDVRRTIWLTFFATSIMVGTVVSIAGPIGFVGMMAPHICRLIIGWNHRFLVPATVLFGGAFLVICDTLARTIMSPVEVPVGIVTAMLGGPFFLWLLVAGRVDQSFYED